MKTLPLNRWILLLLLLLLGTGCMNEAIIDLEEGFSSSNNPPLTLSASLYGVSQEPVANTYTNQAESGPIMGTGFSNQDRLGVSIFDAPRDGEQFGAPHEEADYRNLKATVTTNGGLQLARPVLLGADPIGVRAYFPYNEEHLHLPNKGAFNSESILIPVTSGYTDYMYGYAAKTANDPYLPLFDRQNRTASIAMKHALALISFVVIYEGAIEEITEEPKLQGLKIFESVPHTLAAAGLLNVASGKISIDEKRGATTLPVKWRADDRYTNLSEATPSLLTPVGYPNQSGLGALHTMVIPVNQAVGTLHFSAIIDEVPMETIVPATHGGVVKWEAGNHYVYTLRATKSAFTVDVTIADWHNPEINPEFDFDSGSQGLAPVKFRVKASGTISNLASATLHLVDLFGTRSEITLQANSTSNDKVTYTSSGNLIEFSLMRPIGQRIFRVEKIFMTTNNRSYEIDSYVNVIDEPTFNYTLDKPFLGSGTLADPYQVCTRRTLHEVRNNMSNHFLQIRTVDLEGVRWDPIGAGKNSAFKGLYNGNGYAIQNLNITTSGSTNNSVAALFGYVDGGTIRGVKIASGTITSDYEWVASIVANADKSTIDQCSNHAEIRHTVNGSQRVLGGIVAYSNGSVTNSYNNGQIYSFGANGNGNSERHKSRIGGVIGEQEGGAIKNLCNYTVINHNGNDKDYLDGIVGDHKSGTAETLFYQVAPAYYYKNKTGIAVTSFNATHVQQLNKDQFNWIMGASYPQLLIEFKQ